MTTQVAQPQEKLDKSPTWIPVCLLLFALIFVSSAAILVKFGEREITPQAITFNRFWLTTLILGFWYGLKFLKRRATGDQSIQTSPLSFVLVCKLLLVGIFLSTDLILWSWALTQTSVANATILANLTPVFTSVGMWLFWGKSIERRFLFGMIICLGGAFAMGVGDFNLDFSKLQGDLAALAASLAFSSYLLIVEGLHLEVEHSVILLGSSALASIFVFFLTILTKVSLFPDSFQGWLAVLGLAFICQILGQGIVVYSLNHLSSGFVALCFLLEPILAAIAAWIIFAEKLSILNWVTFAVVLLGIYLALSSSSSVKVLDSID